MGEPGKTAPVVDNYGANNIRKAIIDNAKQVAATHTGDEAKMEVVIHPSEKATYENLVAILDEMSITNIKIYAIVKILPMEVEDLKKNNNW